jgi:hypothetical protein
MSQTQIGAHLSGKVVKKRFGEGSKSDHMAVMLETSAGVYKLRRPGGNPFSDPELEKLVGSEIEGVGNVSRNTYILTDWTVTSGG